MAIFNSRFDKFALSLTSSLPFSSFTNLIDILFYSKSNLPIMDGEPPSVPAEATTLTLDLEAQMGEDLEAPNPNHIEEPSTLSPQVEDHPSPDRIGVLLPAAKADEEAELRILKNQRGQLSTNYLRKLKLNNT
jgi:hypothetical protein